MTEIKCPICNARLRPIGGFYDCPNDHRTWAGTKELWQALIQSQQQLKMLEPIVASLQGRADINAEEARDSNELVAQWYEKYEQSQKDLDTARKALEYVKDAGLFVFAKIEAEKALGQIEHKEK